MTLHPRMGDPWTARLMERQLQHLAEQEDEPPELLVGSLRRHQSDSTLHTAPSDLFSSSPAPAARMSPSPTSSYGELLSPVYAATPGAGAGAESRYGATLDPRVSRRSGGRS